MDLNPISALINEHGSAKIFKERLELAADKYDALLSQKDELERKKSESEAQIEQLKAQLAEAQRKIQSLEARLVSHTSNGAEELNEEQLSLLRYLAEVRDYVRSDQIARTTEILQARTDYYLGKLVDGGYVHVALTFTPKKYALSQNGRAILFELDLI